MRSKPYVNYNRIDPETKGVFNNVTVCKLNLLQKKLTRDSYKERQRSPFSSSTVWEEFQRPAPKRSRQNKKGDNVSYVRLTNGMIMRRINHSIAKQDGRISA